MSLPWNFEAFRRYVRYEVMQQAAATLTLFEGQVLDPRNPRMDEMLSMLEMRTGEPWLPKRGNDEEVLVNVEGDIFRNKGRLLTSLFICEPKEGSAQTPVLKLLPFGRALGQGLISEEEYYNFIIVRYRFPHPAYSESYDAWKDAGRTLYPFIFLLEAMVSLYEKGDQRPLTTNEIARFLHPVSDHARVDSCVNAIADARSGTKLPDRERSDEVDRKITDLMGFLSLTPYCMYKDRGIALNLVAKHTVEGSHYWERRKAGDSGEENKLMRLKDLLSESKPKTKETI